MQLCGRVWGRKAVCPSGGPDAEATISSWPPLSVKPEVKKVTSGFISGLVILFGPCVHEGFVKSLIPQSLGCHQQPSVVPTYALGVHIAVKQALLAQKLPGSEMSPSIVLSSYNFLAVTSQWRMILMSFFSPTRPTLLAVLLPSCLPWRKGLLLFQPSISSFPHLGKAQKQCFTAF